jgi:hypothetical protein
MMSFCKLNRRQRINQRNRCEQLSALLDWKLLNHYYTFARDMALQRTFPEDYVAEPIPEETFAKVTCFSSFSFDSVSASSLWPVPRSAAVTKLVFPRTSHLLSSLSSE